MAKSEFVKPNKSESKKVETKVESKPVEKKENIRITLTDWDYIEVARGFMKLPESSDAIRVRRVRNGGMNGAYVNRIWFDENDAMSVARRRADRDARR